MAFNLKKLAIGGLTAPLQGRLLPKGIGGKFGAGLLGGKLTRGIQRKAGIGKRSRKKTGRRT